MASAASYVVFGEALTDFIQESAGRWRSVAGGSPWNVARVGARLGLPTAFAGAVGKDVFGEELLRLSRAAGLDPRFVQQVDRLPLLAMVVSKHPPQYFFIGENSADLHFDPAALPKGWVEAAEVVHFGSLGLVREPLASRLVAVAERVRAAGRRIAFDPNYRNLMTEAYRPTLRRMAELADYIKVSDEEVSQALAQRARAFPDQEKIMWDYYRKNPRALAEIRAPLFEEKVVDHIISQVKLVDRKVSRDELLKANDDDDANAAGGEAAPVSVPN